MVTTLSDVFAGFAAEGTAGVNGATEAFAWALASARAAALPKGAALPRSLAFAFAYTRSFDACLELDLFTN